MPDHRQQIGGNDGAPKAEHRDIGVGEEHIGDDEDAGDEQAENLDPPVAHQEERHDDDGDVDRVRHNPRDQPVKQIDVLVANRPTQVRRRQPAVVHKVWDELQAAQHRARDDEQKDEVPAPTALQEVG